MNNDGCPGNGWSIISSAPTNSQLAGVLAGFIFTGVIILFSRPGPKNTQAMGLFSATFVVLAFDSYLFSLVSGGDTDRVCTRVWSEAIAASGMLGAGGVGLIGSIAWLLANHEGHAAVQVDQAEGSAGVAVALDRLSRAMLFGVSVAVMLLLAATSSDYLDIMFDRNKPVWLTWMMLCSPVVVGAIAWVLLRRQARNRRRVAAAVDLESEQTQMLSRVSFGMLVYAVVGPVYAGVLTNLPNDVWAAPAIPIAIVTLIVGLATPAVLLVTVVLSAPPVVSTHQLARSSTVADPGDELSAADDGATCQAVQAARGTNSLFDRSREGGCHTADERTDQVDQAAVLGVALAAAVSISAAGGAWEPLESAVGLVLIFLVGAYVDASQMFGSARRGRRLALAGVAALSWCLVIAWPLQLLLACLRWSGATDWALAVVWVGLAVAYALRLRRPRHPFRWPRRLIQWL